MPEETGLRQVLLDAIFSADLSKIGAPVIEWDDILGKDIFFRAGSGELCAKIETLGQQGFSISGPKVMDRQTKSEIYLLPKQNKSRVLWRSFK